MRSRGYATGGFRLADLSEGRRGRFGVLSIASGGGDPAPPMPDRGDQDAPVPIGEPTGPIPVPPGPDAPPMQLHAVIA